MERKKIKVLINLSPNVFSFYPKTVRKAMDGKEFPYCRIAGAEAIESEGLMNVVSPYGFDATSVIEENGEVVSVCGRHNIYYAYDKESNGILVYAVEEVDVGRPWTIRKNAGTECILYGTVNDKIHVLIPELNFYKMGGVLTVF